MEEKIKLIITDDKEEYRGIFLDMIEAYSFIEVIAQAENGKELLHLLSKHYPDVVLLDLNMPVMDGNEAFSIICDRYPETKVIILSQHFERVLVENYIERGAKGYIPKDAIMNNEPLLINAISKVSTGGLFIYEDEKSKNIFTRSQKELLPLIVNGETVEDIAKEAGITVRTVEKHKQHIYQTVGTKKSIDFYRYAFLRGLQFLGKIVFKAKENRKKADEDLKTGIQKPIAKH